MNRTNFRITLLTAAVLGSLIIAFSLGGHSSNGRAQFLTVPGFLAERDGPGLAMDEQDLEVEVITVTENGFDPPLITRTRGPFIVALHNRSGESELVFRIFRAQGERLHEIRLRAGRRANHLRLDPPIGDYIISETNHPSWSCALTITR